MEIRLLQPGDAAAYLKLRLEALRLHPEAFGSSYEEERGDTPDKYERRFAAGASFTYGAFVDGRLAGSVTLVPEVRLKLRHRANLVAVYVSERCRRQGAAKALLEAVHEQALELEGLEQLHLGVASTNEAALSLYEGFGFESYGEEKRSLKIEGAYVDERLMVKFLYPKKD
ncbi:MULTISPECIES: GNAT family N-acetyltransferase [Saccharibacillus]|uniref:GNAT family N-acetyltransferase n=1 Tax=Saccharibacillus TaxID=456492 RepID=UPI00123BE31C|nr:GNAT family N-acetyltransferase [Saccharibacillus sp. WB 17]MWJ33020.1 GNAT family N-acetyltransferase [Saccharibacillus sp. WB 17]